MTYYLYTTLRFVFEYLLRSKVLRNFVLEICSNQYFSHISSIDKFVGRQEFIKYVDGENKRKGFFSHYVIEILLSNTWFRRSEWKSERFYYYG